MIWLKRVGGLFNSVIFGITLMAAIGLYIAFGSGLPHVREYFEMNEMQFFNAWPLKLLMLLLVVNLMTVTWIRIPLTPPRYGVWCVHLGIITLILSTSFYYRNKVEGLTRIFSGRSVDYFYKTGDRALYARVGGRLTAPWAMPSLPRFKDYTDPNVSALHAWDLQNFTPAFLTVDPTTNKEKIEGLPGELGIKDLNFEVTGYWPYAELRTDYVTDAMGESAGIAINLPNRTAWLIGTDPIAHSTSLGDIELDHRMAVDATELNALKQSANQLHHIVAKVGSFSQTLDVQIGKTYKLGDTGYTISVESFDPAFPMSGTGEIAQVLTLHVKNDNPNAKVAEFRRMLLSGRDLQTDFLLNAAGAGPMGKRQKAPVDNDLVLLYTLNDMMGLLPLNGREKHTIVTAPNVPGMTDIVTALDHATDIKTIAGDTGEITVEGAAVSENGQAHQAIKLNLEREDHLRRQDHVEDVPSALRDRDVGQAGIFQILRVRLTSGDWSQTVYVPYSQYVAEEDWNDPSSDAGRTIAPSRPIFVPGAKQPLELRLGQEYDILPARLTLDKFEAVAYDGAGKTGSSMMRDFKSTLSVENRDNGEKTTDVAHMNHPVYFGHGSWLFFQAQWDPQGQRYTVLGVGNRPGVPVMVAGCVMIVIGLLYAFYAKPFVIRRMKRKALARAVQSGKIKSPHKEPEPVAAGVS